MQESVAQLQTQTSENEIRAAQLEDQVMKLEETRACHGEMREILEANVPLTETPRQLHQARDLAQVLASRVVEVPRRRADAQCEQDGDDQPVVQSGDQ